MTVTLNDPIKGTTTYSVTVTRVPMPTGPIIDELEMQPNVALLPAYDPSILTYMATVTNSVNAVSLVLTRTTDPSATVSVLATLPDGTQVSCTGGNPYDCPLNVGDNVITVTITDPVKGTTTYTITITREALPPGTGADIQVILTMSGSELDLVKSENINPSSVDCYPACPTDPPPSGEELYPSFPLTLNVTLYNYGPEEATGIRINIPLPDGYHYKGDTINGDLTASAINATSYDVETGIWTVSNLAVDGTTEMEIYARMRFTGTYTVTASLDWVDQGDPYEENNQDQGTRRNPFDKNVFMPILTTGLPKPSEGE